MRRKVNSSLKPAAVQMNSASNRSKSNSSLPRPILYGLLTCLITIPLSIYTNPNVWINLWSNISGSRQLKPHFNDATPKNVIPTIDEYKILAKQKEWYPIDPMEKLNATISRYTQILEETDKKHLEKSFSMLLEEIRFLMRVFRHTSSSSPAASIIDLTPSLYLAIEVLNQCNYRLMKQRIRLQSSMIVNKEQVQRYGRQWLEGPLRELLSIKLRPSEPPSTIIIDPSRPIGRGKMNALQLAVQLRQYGLFSVFAALSPSSIGPALRIAVINGDDLALALLLQLSSSSSSSSQEEYDRELVEHVIAALEISTYYHPSNNNTSSTPLYDRLTQKLAELVSKHDVSVLPTDCPYEADLQQVIDSQQQTHNATSIELSLSLSYPIRPVAHKQQQQQQQPQQQQSSWEEGLSYCDIPTITLQTTADTTLTEQVNSFHQKFIQLNRPAIIALDPAILDTVSAAVDSWYAPSTVAGDKGEGLKVSSLPYGQLFGVKEKTMSRSAFAAYLANNHSASNIEPPLYHFATVIADSSQHRDKEMQAAIRSFLSSSGLTLLIDSIYQLHVTANTATSALLPGRLQVFRGPNLSGAPMHNHGPAFNFLLPPPSNSNTRVNKLWQLRPPGSDRYSAIHPLLAWRQDEISGSNGSSSCLVRQTPGQVLFVPRHVSHMVLNLVEGESSSDTEGRAAAGGGGGGGVVTGFVWELDDYIY